MDGRRSLVTLMILAGAWAPTEYSPNVSIEFYVIVRNKNGFTVEAGGEVLTEVEDAART
jgi:hypothetical protein